MNGEASGLEYIRCWASRVEARLTWLVPGPDRAPARLVEAMRYSLFGGGKRLRPVMLIASADAAGCDVENVPEVLDAACALEMVHTYSLIHDDLPCMDDDDCRRGKPTSHRVFGEAGAVLAGDALLTLAFEVLYGVAATAAPAARERISRAAGAIAAGAGPCGMAGGQILDLELAGKTSGAAEIERMRLLKTGSLFEAAAVAGGILGGAGEEEIAALRLFARRFGLGFQIGDDIEDAGSEAQAGRTSCAGFTGAAAARAAALGELLGARACLGIFGGKARVLEGITRLIESRLAEGVDCRQ